MDPVTSSILEIRKNLTLQPRQELIDYLERRVVELVNTKSTPFAIEAGQRALTDLQASDKESILIQRVKEWIRSATTELDPEKRSILAQLGAFIMSASVSPG